MLYFSREIMVPNCVGCEMELFEAYEWDKMGCDIALEGMGERRHIIMYVFEKNGKVIVG